MCNYKLTVTIGKNSDIVDGGGWVTSMTWRKSTILKAKDRAQVLARIPHVGSLLRHV